MNMSLLTFDILRKFENEYVTNDYTEKEQRTIENAARTAMINRHSHYKNGENWTEVDIFKEFIIILKENSLNIKTKQCERTNR